MIVYEQDIPKEQITIVKKSHKKGRPQEKAEIVQETEMTETHISLPRPTKVKEPSARQLKHMELATQFAMMEQVAGRPLRKTTRGGVDQRCIAPRTAKQIASAKALVERNLMKKLAKQKEEEAKTAQTVKTVIGELTTTYEEKVQKEPAPPPTPAPVKQIATRDLFKN